MYDELNQRIATYLTEIENGQKFVEKLLDEIKLYPVWQQFDVLYETTAGEWLLESLLNIVLAATKLYEGLGYNRELIREGLSTGTLTKNSPFETAKISFCSCYVEIVEGSVPDRVLNLATELALQVDFNK